MPNRKIKILLISHDASLSGAPILLLPLLKYMAGMGVQIDILLGKGGPLESEFAKYGDVTILNRPFLKLNLTSRILHFIERNTTLKWRHRRIFDKINQKIYNGVVSNTSVNGDILSQITHPYCVYVHELKTTSSFFKTKNSLTKQLSNASKIFYPSYAVRNFLHYDCQVPIIKTVHMPYFFDVHKIGNVNSRLKELKDDGNILIGMSGGVSIRKGIFPFIETLNFIVKNIEFKKKFKFVWVGANLAMPELDAILPLIEKLKLEQYLVFLPITNVPLESIACLDVFFLSSIEDPYPLVAIEAALLKKPIVCFSNAGGTPEFVEEDAGICVPLYDISAAASAIVKLAESEELRLKLGSTGYEKSLSQHCNISIAKGFLNEILYENE